MSSEETVKRLVHFSGCLCCGPRSRPGRGDQQQAQDGKETEHDATSPTRGSSRRRNNSDGQQSKAKHEGNHHAEAKVIHLSLPDNLRVTRGANSGRTIENASGVHRAPLLFHHDYCR